MGITCGYLPSKLFALMVDKVIQRNIILKMCLAELCKIISFILVVSLVFKFLPIEPVLFITSVIIFLIMSFAKNLLKLII